MNKIAQSLIAASAAILLLAGCSSLSSEARDVPEPSATASQPASGPVAVVPVESSAAPKSATVADAERMFIKTMHGDVANQGLEGVSDADLLKAGYYACVLFAQGQKYNEMDVIQGDAPADAARHDRDIASVASQVLCTEYDISK